jgi:hypothetical protein
MVFPRNALPSGPGNHMNSIGTMSAFQEMNMGGFPAPDDSSPI